MHQHQQLPKKHLDQQLELKNATPIARKLIFVADRWKSIRMRMFL